MPSRATILDFWRWALGDLRMNTARSWVAEFLVALALDDPSALREEWASHDVTAADGTRVEVKASAYLQSWVQRKPTPPSFTLTGAKEIWDPERGVYTVPDRGRVDVWVFALQTASTHDEYDALDLAQWRFWAAPNAQVEGWGQKSGRLSLIERQCGIGRPWEELPEIVSRASPHGP